MNYARMQQAEAEPKVQARALLECANTAVPNGSARISAFDALIRERFGALLSAVLAGLSFGAAPHEVLARIIVLDQFTRNMHRDTPLAFAGDAQARAAELAFLTEPGSRF